jgi:hypothetical protein
MTDGVRLCARVLFLPGLAGGWGCGVVGGGAVVVIEDGEPLPDLPLFQTVFFASGEASRIHASG